MKSVTLHRSACKWMYVYPNSPPPSKLSSHNLVSRITLPLQSADWECLFKIRKFKRFATCVKSPLTSNEGGLACNVCYVCTYKYKYDTCIMPIHAWGWVEEVCLQSVRKPSLAWALRKKEKKEEIIKSCQTPPNATRNQIRFPAIHPFTATRWPRFFGQEASGGYLRRISDAQVTRAPQQPNRPSVLYTPALRVYSRLGNRRH